MMTGRSSSKNPWKASSRYLLRIGLVSVFLLVGMLATPTSLHAISFNFTSDHCTGGCGNAPFGNVTLAQNGANVDVTVNLTAGYLFVQTGAADLQNFKFNATGVVLGDITVDAHSPALVADTGNFNGNSTGNFAFGITCPSCSNGSSGAFTADIVFHVKNASIADLTAANSVGTIFVADVLGPNGNTGPVGVIGTPTTNTPEPASILLLGFAFAGMGAAMNRFPKKK